MTREWNHKIFSVTEMGFEALALEIFHYQFDHNKTYRQFANAVNKGSGKVNTPQDIPFLPISFFKTHEIKTGDFEPGAVFVSSGTSQTGNSRHFVKDISLYEKSFITGFESRYGSVTGWCIIGLLPSYLERNNSSLVFMVNRLIEKSGHPASGFYLDDLEGLSQKLKELETSGQKTLLIGVSFALLDFAERFSQKLQHTVIMETGGMKGRREEMTREALHDILKNSFQLDHIHSEYGMTELLSQSYSTGEGIFHAPPWMKVFIRDEEDPFTIKKKGSGAVNIIDLANIHGCSFIATDDVGKVHDDGSFEILGRMDGSDLRGCSLMVV